MPNKESVQKLRERCDPKVQFGPGTAGLVQRLPSNDQIKPVRLRVLKQVNAVGCAHNEY